MAETRTISFRIPGKYVAFLDAVAAEHDTDRTKLLIRILDQALQDYLTRQNSATVQPSPYAISRN